MSGLLSSFFQSILNRLRENVQDQLETAAKRLLKIVAIALAGLTFLLLGLVYLTIGLTQYLATVFGSNALAYGIVGLFLVLIGIIILLLANRRW